MPGIAEFLGESPYKLIITELPDGNVMLTVVNTITNEHAISFTDGAGNEERMPDVRYRWEPPSTLP